MQGSTIKYAFLAMAVATTLPLAACSDENDTPTSPTQAGPPVSTPAPEPTPAPTPTPTPPPAPPSDPIVTVTGPIANLSRSGPDGLDVTFRIDDFTIVRAGAATPVVSGSATGDTSYLRMGQTVSVDGRRTDGFLDATRIIITSQ